MAISVVAGLAAPAGAAAVPVGAPAARPAAVAPLAGDRAASQIVDAPLAAAAEPDQQPSVQFEEAEAHRLDKIDFVPGGRVTVGFTPRAGDPSLVDDRAPTALPAGRLDGASIRRQGVIARPLTSSGTRLARPNVSTDAATALAAPAVSVDQPNAAPPAEPATLASFQTSPEAAVAPTPQAAVGSGLRREVFGFLPYWQLNSSTLRLDYSRLSTIAYFGVGVDATGHLRKRNANGSTSTGWSGWTSAKMTSIISAAHRNHTRVVLTVQAFGWNASGMDTQKHILALPSSRLTLARQIAAAVRDRGADGVNVDFEPLARGWENHFVALLKSIRAELNRIHSGYQVTFDATASVANYPIAAATGRGAADAVFVMGYDYRSAGSNPVGSIAPYAGSGYDVRDTIVAYRSRVAASKIILGVPYYGRAWSTPSATPHARNTSSTRSGASVTVTYDTAASFLAAHGRHYDTTEQVAWTAYKRQNCTTTYGCYVSWRQLYVDDAKAIRAKFDLVNRYGLRGAGIWALGYDGTRRELWNAIWGKFVPGGH